ncbi:MULTISPECIES: BglG family transcription antiterminator [Clostridium]|uniref:BglG family transcription antiterminator n=1 Tax=Clostridium porci TaxID=2605778 RepID=A0A7X2NMH0_9CLOT|nr:MULTISPECIES: BglG family transcription antiterminator [Clostridium]MCI6138415.1 BglG family transcription antiterminator [Clostridium sp.]MSS37415.1 BglG family transcription antiterminator [Clostridium porci]
MLNKRIVTILRDICIDGKAAGVEALAAQYGISNRMVRYDLNHINEFLKENGFSTQLKVKKSEVMFDTSAKERETIKALIDSWYDRDYILSRKERAVWIIFRLLHPSLQGIITYETLCEELKISRSTLICDIRYVRKRLEGWNLKMVSIGKKGFCCIGKEKAIRSCIRNFLTGEKAYAAEQLFEYQVRFHSPEMNLYSFTKEEIDWIKDETDRMQKKVGVILSDMDLVKFISVILIAVRRIRMGCLIDSFEAVRPDIKNWREYDCCRRLRDRLSKRYDIMIPEDEIIYLMSYFISASKTYGLKGEREDCLKEDLIANKIIARFNKITGKHISFSEEMNEYFMNHVKSMVFRMEFDISVTNPFLDEIKQKYPQIFISILDSCSFLEQYFGKRLSEHEIGYMALYFQMALEDEGKEEHLQEKKIVITCASGVVTGKVIANRLKKRFKFHLLGTTSCHHIQEFLKQEEPDLIISSIPLKETLAVPVIVVSPMLTKEDINNLKDMLPAVEKQKDNKQLMEEILSVVEEHVEPVQMERIKNILKMNFHIEPVTAYKEISRILSLEDILLNLQVSDWREGIRLSAEPMQKKGIIGDSYITRMIETVERLGAYIVITDDIAMPHAAPGDDVYSFGITMAVFNEPIAIFNRDGIKMFIAIAMKEEENYRDVIMEIMELAEDRTFIELMYHAKSPENIYRYIVYGDSAEQ